MSWFQSRRKRSRQWGNAGRWRAVRRNRGKRAYTSPTLAGIFWLDQLAGCFFTVQGRILLIALLPIAFFALLLTRSPAFLLFVLIVFLFLLDWLGKIVFPRRLQLIRQPPARVVCGVPFEIRTRVRNDSFLPAYDFEVNRNLTPALVRSGKNAPLYCLPPHSEMVIRQTYQLKQRGIYDLPPAAAEGVFPFRLTKAIRKADRRQTIICHPDYTQFRDLRLPGGNRNPGRNDLNSTHRSGSGLDFLACREYRSGDDPRKIHWGASARRNRLVVKEFQEEQRSSAAVILDNCCPSSLWRRKDFLKRMILLKPLTESAESPFEAAVSLTASIAHSLAGQNFVIDVFASGSEIHHFRTGRNTMSFEAFLDLLSSLESSHSEMRFDRLPAAELNRAAAAEAVFLILLHVDPESEKLYRALVRRGANLRTFVLDADGPVPEWAERLTSEEILQNRRTEL